MFDPVVGQIMRIYGYFVMKKAGSQRVLIFYQFLVLFKIKYRDFQQEEHELRVMQRTGSLMYQLAHKRTQPKISVAIQKFLDEDKRNLSSRIDI